MNAVNKPTRTAPQTRIVQTYSVDQPSLRRPLLSPLGKTLEPTSPTLE